MAGFFITTNPSFMGREFFEDNEVVEALNGFHYLSAEEAHFLCCDWLFAPENSREESLEPGANNGAGGLEGVWRMASEVVRIERAVEHTLELAPFFERQKPAEAEPAETESAKVEIVERSRLRSRPQPFGSVSTVRVRHGRTTRRIIGNRDGACKDFDYLQRELVPVEVHITSNGNNARRLLVS